MKVRPVPAKARKKKAGRAIQGELRPAFCGSLLLQDVFGNKIVLPLDVLQFTTVVNALGLESEYMDNCDGYNISTLGPYEIAQNLQAILDHGQKLTSPDDMTLILNQSGPDSCVKAGEIIPPLAH